MHHDDSSPETLERLEHAEQLKLNGNYEQAIGILEAVLLEDPENVSALEEVADNELSLGEYRRAETAAKRAISLDSKSYTGHYILGFIRSRSEQWDEATTHLQKANQLKSNNAEILRCLGWALFHSGQRAQGIVTLERSLNLDQDSTLTLCDLGVTYMEVRNFVKSRTLLERALELDPGNARVKECLATVERLSLAFAEQR